MGDEAADADVEEVRLGDDDATAAAAMYPRPAAARLSRGKTRGLDPTESEHAAVRSRPKMGPENATSAAVAAAATWSYRVRSEKRGTKF